MHALAKGEPRRRAGRRPGRVVERRRKFLDRIHDALKSRRERGWGFAAQGCGLLVGCASADRAADRVDRLANHVAGDVSHLPTRAAGFTGPIRGVEWADKFSERAVFLEQAPESPVT